MSLLEDRLWNAKVYSDGWVDGQEGRRDVVEPATGAVLGQIGLAGRADVARAAESAARAQIAWAARTPEERAAVMRRAGALWEQHASEVDEWIIREGGSTNPKAALESHRAASDCYEAAGLATHPQGSVLATNEQRWSFARRRPAGVVAVISPFNFPLILSIRSIAPALALGNAVILKPDPRTAVSGGVLIARIFEEAGLPTGVFHVLPGGAEVGEALITVPETAVVAFTGSTAAGRKVGELASRHLKRVHLELGGNNALIVLPGAEVRRAASAGAFGSFLHQGQICMASGRHLVHRSLHDGYVEALAEIAQRLPVGDPFTGQVALGPIIDQGQLSRVDAIVKDTVTAGASVAAGGTHDGLFYRPTVLAEVSTSMRAWTEEIFGPVAPVVPFDSLDEAIALASASDYGLSLGILGDVGTAMRVADAVPSGIVHINEQTVADEPFVPFGGVGASGNGARFGGPDANIDAYTSTQWLTVRPEIAPYPF